jgi:hypothetical protein
MGAAVSAGAVAEPAAARLAEDGGVAMPVPATATGVASAEGRVGAAVRATTDDSFVGVSRFHQAQRGPDWHPSVLTTASATTIDWTKERLIRVLPRLGSSTSPREARSNAFHQAVVRTTTTLRGK